jgi:hypothetical protein
MAVGCSIPEPLCPARSKPVASQPPITRRTFLRMSLHCRWRRRGTLRDLSRLGMTFDGSSVSAYRLREGIGLRLCIVIRLRLGRRRRVRSRRRRVVGRIAGRGGWGYNDGRRLLRRLLRLRCWRCDDRDRTARRT